MKPKEFEVFKAAAAESRLPSWFESTELTEITSDLVARGLIEKVDLHKARHRC